MLQIIPLLDKYEMTSGAQSSSGDTSHIFMCPPPASQSSLVTSSLIAAKSRDIPAPVCAR